MFTIFIGPRKTNNLLLAIFLLSIIGLAMIFPWVMKAKEPKIASGVHLEGVDFGGLTAEEAEEKVKAMANLKVQWPQDAKFLDEETLQEGAKGRLVAIEENLLKLKAAPPNAKLKIQYYSLEPMVNVEEISSLKYGLATSKEFHFLDATDLSLLKQISKRLYNQVLYPGEEFSLNSFLAASQDNTEYSQAISQIVARSLYHCILQGNLQFTEKWETQEPKVGSATTDNISYGLGRDLKFVNNLETPILIRSSVDSELLKIWLLTSQDSR